MSNYFRGDPARQGPPGPEDARVEHIVIDFAFPVWVGPEQQRALLAVVETVVKRPANQPVGGVHWISGYGSRPQFSAADRALLGAPAARAGDPVPPDGAEPTWDDRALHIETSARPWNQTERRIRRDPT